MVSFDILNIKEKFKLLHYEKFSLKPFNPFMDESYIEIRNKSYLYEKYEFLDYDIFAVKDMQFICFQNKHTYKQYIYYLDG